MGGRRVPRVQWVGLVALVAALVAPMSVPPGCSGQQVPPAPPAAAELSAASEPVPWPAEPVGGPALGTCGDVGGGPPIDAAAWVLADLDTGAVLAARAPHARHRPASTLKVLTALVVLQRLDPDAVIEGAAEDLQIDGSRAGIGPGGRYTVRQLLAGLLLNSGNDTAQALARALGGDAETVAAMAAVARESGALDTRPATPSGLDGPGMSSSAYDVALLFRVAMRDPLFATTAGTRSVAFPGYGDRPGFELSNNSRLLARYPGALGSKAGFTDATRHTLVGAAERGDRRLVVALMRGEQHPVPMWRAGRSAAGLGLRPTGRDGTGRGPRGLGATGGGHDRSDAGAGSGNSQRPAGRRRSVRRGGRTGGSARGRGGDRPARGPVASPPPMIAGPERHAPDAETGARSRRSPGRDAASSGSERRRPASSRPPRMPVTTPAPRRPAAVPPVGPERTTTSERMIAGPGTGTGASCSFSLAVAAHAVTNSTKRDTKKMNTSRPRNEPNTAPLGDAAIVSR